MNALWRTVCLVLTSLLPITILWSWGSEGHKMIARVAVAHLPPDMPAFFTSARAQLEFLNPEPDTWRDRRESDMGGTALSIGHDGDHIFKFEHYSPEKLPPNRYEFVDTLHKEGRVPKLVGMLPYRAAELFQRIRSAFRRWRATDDPQVKRFLEARIVDDAGILGHYIADASMPLHMSINRNGWEQPENPKEYTRDNTLHARFEGAFVRARVKDADLQPFVRKVSIAREPMSFIYSHMKRSYDQMIPLYELEKVERFGPENKSPEALKFVASRMADAATTLRDLWYTAWITSAE